MAETQTPEQLTCGLNLSVRLFVQDVNAMGGLWSWLVSIRRRILLRIVTLPWIRERFFRQLGFPSGRFGKVVATILLPIFNESSMRMVVEQTPRRAEERILEIGFGSGDMLQLFLNESPCTKAPIFGLDITKSLVSHARERHDLHGRVILGSCDIQDVNVEETDNKIKWKSLFDEGDLERFSEVLDKEDGIELDIVVSCNWYYFLSDEGMKRATERIWKMLREGGRVVTLIPAMALVQGLQGNADFGGNPDPERWYDALSHAGFEILRRPDNSTTPAVAIACKAARAE